MLTRYRDWGWNDWAMPEIGRTLGELELLRREMDRLFDGASSESSTRAATPRLPRMGLFDRGQYLTLRAELPGVAKDAVDVTVNQGVLSIRGQRKESAPSGYSLHRRERSDFQFARAFNLPCKVDLEKTQAEMEAGVLTVTLPKAEEEKPRHISVRAK